MHLKMSMYNKKYEALSEHVYIRRGKQKVPDSPRSGKKHRRHSRSPHVLSRDIHPGLDSRFELLGIDADQDLALINFERSREALSDSCEYPRLHRSACYISHSSAQLKSHYDDEDYLARGYLNEPEEEETFSSPIPGAGARSARAADSRERFQRPGRRKRKRRKRKALVDVEDVEVELGVDPDDLPPRARWTIVATACLLLAMSLLLVGVTLRMAPIIDEMVRKENEELLNSLKRDSSVPVNASTLAPL